MLGMQKLMNIVEVLLRHKDLIQVLLLRQKSLQTPKLCCLISMDHHGSVSFLISFLRVNTLLHSTTTHTQQHKPHRDQFNYFTLFLLEIGQRFRVGSMDVIYYILQYPFILKNLGTPTMQQVFSPQDETHYTFIITRSPKSSHMSCHTTTPKIFNALIISLVGPQKKHAKTSRPFLDILDATEVQSLGFF